MTKRHFEAFAAAIKTKYCLDKPWEDVRACDKIAAYDTIDIVCRVAHESNHRFDEARFRAACGVPA